MLEVASDDLYERDPHAILETFLVYQQTVGPKGLSARTLRALYNARHLMDAKFRRDPVNHATFMKILKASGGADARLSADERDQRARPLSVGVPAHRRPDAARPVPRLHGRPAHPDGAAQRAPLPDPRARARVPVLLAARVDVRPALGALHRRALPRHRQGPRRRPLRARHARGAPLLPRSRRRRRGRRAGRVPRRRAPDDVADRAEGGPFRPRRHRRFRRRRRQRAPADRALPPHRRRRPRHEPQGLERVEGQAARGPLPPHPARARRRPPQPRRRDRGDASSRRASSSTCAMLPGTIEVPLWRTLELSYFARHDASEIAWHTRSLVDLVDSPKPVVRARVSPLGVGLQVLVYAPDRQDLFARTCGYFDSANFNILDAKVHTTTIGYALDTFLVVSPHLEPLLRDLIAYVETQLAIALEATGPLPEPSRGRISRRVRSFPVTPRVTLRPDERAPALAARGLGERSLGPSLRDLARARPPRHQPAAGQDHDARRARRGHLPDRRSGAAAEQDAAADRDRDARRHSL